MYTFERINQLDQCVFLLLLKETVLYSCQLSMVHSVTSNDMERPSRNPNMNWNHEKHEKHEKSTY